MSTRSGGARPGTMLAERGASGAGGSSADDQMAQATNAVRQAQAALNAARESAARSAQDAQIARVAAQDHTLSAHLAAARAEAAQTAQEAQDARRASSQAASARERWLLMESRGLTPDEIARSPELQRLDDALAQARPRMFAAEARAAQAATRLSQLRQEALSRVANREAITRAAIAQHPDVVAALRAYEAAQQRRDTQQARVALQEARAFLGAQFSAAQLRRLVGARPGDEIAAAESYGGLALRRRGADGAQSTFVIRRLNATDAARAHLPDGSLVADVVFVSSGRKTTSSGRALLTGFQAFRDVGVARISFIAGKGTGPDGKPMNGYYTWAKMGAKGSIAPAVRAKFPEGYRQYTRVEDLLRAPGGRAVWKRYGVQFKATIDLTPGSRTLAILDEMAARERHRR